VRYELGCYIPEDGILHSYRRENLKSYIALTGLQRRSNVSPVRYELGFYIQEDEILLVAEVKTSNISEYKPISYRHIF
jgi:hypothetical protein